MKTITIQLDAMQILNLREALESDLREAEEKVRLVRSQLEQLINQDRIPTQPVVSAQQETHLSVVEEKTPTGRVRRGSAPRIVLAVLPASFQEAVNTQEIANRSACPLSTVRRILSEFLHDGIAKQTKGLWKRVAQPGETAYGSNGSEEKVTVKDPFL